MTPYESATSEASPRWTLFESQHLILFFFFSNRWIVKKEHVYSGASQKKSKHHRNIKFITNVNSTSFSSGRKLKVSEITLVQLVEGVSNRMSYFDSFLLFKLFFKALGVGQVKDVKQSWYPIITRNVFAIISPTSLCSWISPTMLMMGRWIFFSSKIESYEFKKGT